MNKLFVVFLLIILLSNCKTITTNAKNDSLIGEWNSFKIEVEKDKPINGSLTIIFYNDGNFKMVAIEDISAENKEEKTITGTFKILNDKEMLLTSDNDEEPANYSLKNDTLIIANPKSDLKIWLKRK